MSDSVSFVMVLVAAMSGVGFVSVPWLSFVDVRTQKKQNAVAALIILLVVALGFISADPLRPLRALAGMLLGIGARGLIYPAKASSGIGSPTKGAAGSFFV